MLTSILFFFGVIAVIVILVGGFSVVEMHGERLMGCFFLFVGALIVLTGLDMLFKNGGITGGIGLCVAALGIGVGYLGYYAIKGGNE